MLYLCLICVTFVLYMCFLCFMALVTWIHLIGSVVILALIATSHSQATSPHHLQTHQDNWQYQASSRIQCRHKAHWNETSPTLRRVSQSRKHQIKYCFRKWQVKSYLLPLLTYSRFSITETSTKTWKTIADLTANNRLSRRKPDSVGSKQTWQNENRLGGK